MQFEITYELRANAWRRLANYLIDLAVQYGISYMLGLLIGALTYLDIYAPYEYVTQMNTLEMYFWSYIISFCYYFGMETLTGGYTIGKYITNTKVLTWYGEKPSVATIAKRSLCRMIPFNQFSFLTENPLGWHDNLSDTVVVDIKKFNEEHSLREGFRQIGMPEA